MTTQLIPARSVRIGDTLRYLSTDPLIVREIVPVKTGSRDWLVFKHDGGSHRASIFAHVNRESAQERASAPTFCRST